MTVFAGYGIAKESGDTVGQGRAYGNLGEAYHSLGDLCGSEDFYKLSVEQYDAVRISSSAQ